MAYRVLSFLLPVDIVNNILFYAHDYENEYTTHVLHICKLLNCEKIKCIRHSLYKLKENESKFINKTRTEDIYLECIEHYKEKIKVIKDYNFAKFLVYSNADPTYYMSISTLTITYTNKHMIKIKDYVEIFPRQLTLQFVKYWIKKNINRCEDCVFQQIYKRYVESFEYCCVNCDYSKCTDEIVMSCPGSDFNKCHPYTMRKYPCPIDKTDNRLIILKLDDLVFEDINSYSY